MADVISADAVEEHDSFTADVMLFVIDEDMLDFMQAQDAKAAGPLLGQRAQV
jgi:hypothetical protein